MASVNTIPILDISGLSQLDILIADVDKLVSLPDIYYRLESAIENPASTTTDFVNLLGTEPDLCARLLRMANSAFYSFPAEIETVERAIGTIGLRQIRELVLATSVIKMFDKLPLNMVNMKSFWEHSVAVGVLAKSIAQYASLPQSDRYYIPGLLHDIGRLVMYLKLPGMMSELLIVHNGRDVNLHVLEQQRLSYSHAEIGGRLLENWKVPASIHESVFYHHRPAEASEHAHITCAIHIADAWVNKHQVGSSGERYMPAIRRQATQLLGVEEFELAEIWALAKEEINDVVRQFLSH